MFCVINKPIIEAHAIAGELVLGVYFILASVATYLGVTFATNQDAQNGLSDWFYSMGDDLKNMIDGYAKNWVSGYNTIMQWEASGWQTICQSCSDYFSSFNDPSVVKGKFNITNSDGYIGFTKDTVFSFTVPSGSSSSTMSVDYNLPAKGASLGICNNVRKDNLSSSPYGSYFTGYYLASPSGLVAYQYTQCLLGTSFVPQPCYGYQVPYELFNTSQYFSFSPFYGIRFFYDQKTNKLYDKSDCEEHPFRLKSGNTYYTTPDGISSWDTYEDFGMWLFESCGFVVKSSSITDGTAGVYVPGADNVKVDTGRLSEKVKESQNLGVDDTFSTVLPGTQDYLDEMAANPDLVTDVAAEGVYNSDFPAVKSDPLLWQTKFPFCIPWDIYNLFAGFFTTSQCPTFTFILLPENSFGFGNDEITFTIDFSEYNTIVQIIRFFLGVFFVYGLIFATRKLVWSGG